MWCCRVLVVVALVEARSVNEGAVPSTLEAGGTLGDVARQVFRDDKLTEVTDKVVTEMGEVVKSAAGLMGFSGNTSTDLKEDEGRVV